ncbi:hypothetical protein [Shewanella algae]|uniref:hypothetical protein n=1 Tax=Shewanella algae TaxID=38313 RepID=UPI001BF08451|nr:hypothetical protein [Shewanella algae]BCV40855.1 hypothetical protein TUM17378_21170 [Shewanella algae]
MDINNLLNQHAEIGKTIEAAEKANPFVAVTLAKKAAAQSHELMGEFIKAIGDLSKTKADAPFVGSGVHPRRGE